MRISDWSSDVCSSDLRQRILKDRRIGRPRTRPFRHAAKLDAADRGLHLQHSPICADALMQPAETRRVRAFIDRVPALDMILERPHARPEIAIVARHHAAFTAGGHDLVLAEGPGADMADRPDAAPLVARAMRLRAILDHLDTARSE